MNCARLTPTAAAYAYTSQVEGSQTVRSVAPHADSRVDTVGVNSSVECTSNDSDSHRRHRRTIHQDQACDDELGNATRGT
jgi:hypothetical protein